MSVYHSSSSIDAEYGLSRGNLL